MVSMAQREGPDTPKTCRPHLAGEVQGGCTTLQLQTQANELVATLKHQVQMYQNRIANLESELKRQSGIFSKREKSLVCQMESLQSNLQVQALKFQKRVAELKYQLDDVQSIKTTVPDIREIHEVTLKRDENGTLGFNIAGGKSEFYDTLVFISKIQDNSPASEHGLLRINDQILEVNDQSLRGATHQEAVELFRSSSDAVHLKVARRTSVYQSSYPPNSRNISTQTDNPNDFFHGYPDILSLPSMTDLESVGVNELDMADLLLSEDYKPYDVEYELDPGVLDGRVNGCDVECEEDMQHHQHANNIDQTTLLLCRSLNPDEKDLTFETDDQYGYHEMDRRGQLFSIGEIKDDGGHTTDSKCSASLHGCDKDSGFGYESSNRIDSTSELGDPDCNNNMIVTPVMRQKMIKTQQSKMGIPPSGSTFYRKWSGSCVESESQSTTLLHSTQKTHPTPSTNCQMASTLPTHTIMSHTANMATQDNRHVEHNSLKPWSSSSSSSTEFPSRPTSAHFPPDSCCSSDLSESRGIDSHSLENQQNNEAKQMSCSKCGDPLSKSNMMSLSVESSAGKANTLRNSRKLSTSDKSRSSSHTPEERKRSKSSERQHPIRKQSIKSHKHPKLVDQKSQREQSNSRHKTRGSMSSSKTFEEFSKKFSEQNPHAEDESIPEYAKRYQSYLQLVKMKEELGSLYCQSVEAAHDPSTEWKVKIRPDGTRYITKSSFFVTPEGKRLVRSKGMKERAARANEERCLLTTDEETVSELKVGRYWSREERKRQYSMCREKKLKRELMLESRWLETVREDTGLKTVQPYELLSQKKSSRRKQDRILDNFFTIHEIMAHSAGINPLLSVTTV